MSLENRPSTKSKLRNIIKDPHTEFNIAAAKFDEEVLLRLQLAYCLFTSPTMGKAFEKLIKYRVENGFHMSSTYLFFHLPDSAEEITLLGKNGENLGFVTYNPTTHGDNLVPLLYNNQGVINQYNPGTLIASFPDESTFQCQVSPIGLEIQTDNSTDPILIQL